MRGIVDRKGEQFAFVQGNMLYTLDGEPSGHIQGEFVVDLAGQRIWRIVGDAIYSLDGNETIGYLGGERPSDYDI
jgi:hypothetical protein